MLHSDRLIIFRMFSKGINDDMGLRATCSPALISMCGIATQRKRPHAFLLPEDCKSAISLLLWNFSASEWLYIFNRLEFWAYKSPRKFWNYNPLTGDELELLNKRIGSANLQYFLFSGAL